MGLPGMTILFFSALRFTADALENARRDLDKADVYIAILNLAWVYRELVDAIVHGGLILLSRNGGGEARAGSNSIHYETLR